MNNKNTPIHINGLANVNHQIQIWKNVIRSLPKLVKHIRVNMRTMRLAHLIPTWESFLQTGYCETMTRHLDREELAHYRAWWELIFAIAPGREPTRKEAIYALAVIVRKQARDSYSKEMSINHDEYGLTEKEADNIREEVLIRHKDLTRF